ncbi:hypothetical protein ACG33_14560 [Steroidobacter denitrificans]|uniref:Uncharacterized protein n=1 Tax=Steroidobacter denitrificans TaxID=465721 RepID=A0A127FEF9_STEDE|nr:hypothetical protein [Steroidobacter denitrificans]AMN48299.1 hypothetical protein ACG33_14560 [Steroidobacter denitrificans]
MIEAIPALDDILLASLKALAAAGEVEEACRLAGRACAFHRGRNVEAWSRYNVLLHRLARRAAGAGQQQQPD